MSSKDLIWVLEDDPGIRFAYNEILCLRYRLSVFESLGAFTQALTQPELERPVLVIADVRLPDGSFLQFLSSEESESMLQIPFIVVSSLDDIDALRFSFEEGALDYIIKPFQKSELIVKVEQAILKSKGSFASAGQAPAAGKELERILPKLTLKERGILEAFLAAPDGVVSRETIQRRVWNEVKVHPKTLDVHLYHLRRKLLEYDWHIHTAGPGRWKLLGHRVNG